MDGGGAEPLLEAISQGTGFAVGAIPKDAVVRTAELLRAQHRLSWTQLADAFAQRDSRVTPALLAAVSVGETYFFRHPEHFHFIEREVVPAWVGRVLHSTQPRVFRAWSAGCSTGEEAYSLAACLLASLPTGAGVKVEVLGTDLVERNVKTAQAAIYGRWSFRDHPKVEHPVAQWNGERAEILPALRAVTRFQVHNLLDWPPGPPEGFDLVFCRNVLVYFGAERVQEVCHRLAQAVRPGGLLLLGTLESNGAPPGLQRAGKGDAVNAYTRPLPSAPGATPPLSAAAKDTPPADDGASGAPVRSPENALLLQREKARARHDSELYRRALFAIERGQLQAAERALDELLRRSPAHLPALLERALLSMRLREVGRAAERMRDILRLTENTDPERAVPDTDGFTVSYYRSSAEAFLHRLEGK